MEAMSATAFLIFSLAFFMWVMTTVERSHDKQYERRIMEAREFGFDESSKHTTRTLKG